MKGDWVPHSVVPKKEGKLLFQRIIVAAKTNDDVR
ncbi:hypothetical protein SDC9_86863 [bioreactor metagenome]|uniref:Uncharacterized protein n=1 Tax=bioreactor metagenome TaxID=1076179 RepID=A0A644ZNE8_9ZZZZ